jgi:hypothetical protein
MINNLNKIFILKLFKSFLLYTHACKQMYTLSCQPLTLREILQYQYSANIRYFPYFQNNVSNRIFMTTVIHYIIWFTVIFYNSTTESTICAVLCNCYTQRLWSACWFVGPASKTFQSKIHHLGPHYLRPLLFGYKFNEKLFNNVTPKT